jgi:hypothetical protein
MCANISYLMMTLNRYLLVGKDHAPWLVDIAQLEFKRVIRGSILVSALVNIGHGWEYQAIQGLAITHFNDAELSYINSYSYSDIPKPNQGQAYFYFSVAYFAINFGVFFILNTGIEIKIVRRMHKELQDKRERFTKMNVPKSSSSPLTTVSAEAENLSKLGEDKKREKEDGKKEQRVIKMVIINCIFNFLLRAPEMLFWIENTNAELVLFPSGSLFGTSNGQYIQYMPGFLSFIADIGYFAYIVTFSSNFFVFYTFNKNFKEAVVFF